MPHFWRIFRYLNYLISLGLFHGNKPNSDERILIKQKSFCKIFTHIELQGVLLLHIFFSFSGFFDFKYLPIFCIELNQTWQICHLLHQNMLVICGCTSTSRGHFYTTKHFPQTQCDMFDLLHIQFHLIELNQTWQEIHIL